jgi:hypothetical protein
MKKNTGQTSFLSFLTSYIFFLYSIQVITIGLSLLHIGITSWVARAILGLAMATGMLFFFIFGRREKSLPAVEFGRKTWMLIAGFLGFVALIYLILWLAAYVMPDLSWDGNAYHIPTIALWNAKGYVNWVSTPYLEGIINGYPKGMELVSFVIVKAISNSIINASNLIFLPLGILGIATLASLLGVPAWLSICAGAAYVLIPVNINQSVTTYVDSAFASSAIGLLAMAACLCRPDDLEWKNITAFGAVMGLTLGVKSTGVAFSGMALISVGLIWIIDRTKITRLFHIGGEKLSAALKRVYFLPALLVILIISLAGGGYWYLRNLFLAGSPLYPAGLTVLGHGIFPGSSILETISGQSNTLEQLRGWPSFLQVLYTWAQGLKSWPLSLKGYDSRLGGLGFLWLLGCIPAMIIALINFRKFSPLQKRILAVTLSIVGVTFILTPLNWWARYTLWIYGLGLPVFALVIFTSVFNPNLSRLNRLMIIVWLGTCMGMLLFEAAYSTVDVIALSSPGPLRTHLATIFESRSWEWPSNYLFPDMENTQIQTVLFENKNTALGPHGEMDFWHYAGLVGELSQPIGARRLTFLSEEPDNTELANLADIRYILWDKSVHLPALLESRAVSTVVVDDWLILTMP